MNSVRKRIYNNPIAWAAGSCVLLVVMYVLQQVGNWWVSGAVHPREFGNWLGFFMAPLLHGSWGHLLSNLSALFVLVVLTGWLYPRATMLAVPIIWTVAFVTTWLLGSFNSYHIGASGIVYGLMSFAVFLSWFQRDWKAIIGALVVVVFFGGAVAGLLPQEGVSMSAHVGGALGGFLAAYLCRHADKPLKT